MFNIYNSLDLIFNPFLSSLHFWKHDNLKNLLLYWFHNAPEIPSQIHRRHVCWNTGMLNRPTFSHGNVSISSAESENALVSFALGGRGSVIKSMVSEGSDLNIIKRITYVWAVDKKTLGNQFWFVVSSHGFRNCFYWAVQRIIYSYLWRHTPGGPSRHQVTLLRSGCTATSQAQWNARGADFQHPAKQANFSPHWLEVEISVYVPLKTKIKNHLLPWLQCFKSTYESTPLPLFLPTMHFPTKSNIEETSSARAHTHSHPVPERWTERRPTRRMIAGGWNAQASVLKYLWHAISIIYIFHH